VVHTPVSSLAGEFRQKAGELDDKLTCSKPIGKPLLTQVWDKNENNVFQFHNCYF
jgi:hypothetical protein